MPPQTAPSENAQSLACMMLTPIDAAATSSSRMAAHERPSRELSSRCTTKMVSMHSSTMM